MLGLLFFKFQNLLKSARQKVGSIDAVVVVARHHLLLKARNALLHQELQSVDRLFGGGDGFGFGLGFYFKFRLLRRGGERSFLVAHQPARKLGMMHQPVARPAN